ncbi:DegT/DnrJ/EryC1/StrS family aminotransferase [Patescibacteria group bacterium]|nr:DegT/DnrJ/EryC1/StrS family aminotransferase [Patescibacteria group bacterium]
MPTNISWWRTSFGEQETRRIADSIAHEHISQGPVVAEFERRLAEYLGVPFVVATTSGSMALLMALWASGVGPGDEVIVPNRTWIATAHAAILLGAKVRLVDVESDRPIIDVTRIEAAITARTKAVIPVHLNGRSVNMREVNRIAHKHNLVVIEDAAQALGSRNRDGLLGTQSDMGCFSLSVAKIIATGQGGFIATKNKRLYRKLVVMRTHGVADVVNADWTQPGFNFRFNDILASVGFVQLGRLQGRIKKVKTLYARYAAAMPKLPFLKFIPVNLEAGEIPIYIEVLYPHRDRLVQYLATRGIQTRPFYPDLNLAPYFGNRGKFPRSKIFGLQGLFLPSGPEQPLANVKRVLEVLKDFGDTL